MTRPIHTQTAEELSFLLQQVAQSDERSFEQLFVSHKDRVFEIAFLYTESTVLAEEILQDIFVQVWRKRATLPTIIDFPSWLFILTRNRSFNVLRDIARFSSGNKVLEQAMPDTNTDAADSKLLSSEADKLVHQAMERLTPAQRQAFMLIKLKGLSRDETARQMGISPNTVKVHLLAATKSIRAFFLEKDLLIPAVLTALKIIS